MTTTTGNYRSIRTGLRSFLMVVCLAFGAGGMLAGCDDPGPAEEAGREIDDAVEEARDALEEMGEEAEEALEDLEDEID